MGRSRLELVAIIAFAIIAAWSMRFGIDDAYISFNYARTLVEGHGLTWFGDHVEGYTNFAWVLWVAAGMAVGLDPFLWAWFGSLVALGVVIGMTYAIARVRTDSTTVAAAAAGLLATCFTVLAFGTSGLETMPQTALLAVATWQVERFRRGRSVRLAVLSVVVALAIATRLDSSVIGAVLGVVVAARLIATRAGVRAWLAAVGPAAVLLGGWFAWKLYYYGDVLPNTFHVKVDGSTRALGQGAWYVGSFFTEYMLWPVIAIGIAAAATRRTFTPRLPAAIVVAWLAYVSAVGGDFMEFRFIVPALPMLFVMLAELICIEPMPAPWPPPRRRALALVGVLAALSLRHAVTYKGSDDRTVDSIHQLATLGDRIPDGDWGEPCRPLHDVLVGTGATLSSWAAGIVPYFSELPTVDQLGLADAWVALNGVRPPAENARPGHQRYATYDYLVSRKVTFVVGSVILPPRTVFDELDGRSIASLLKVFLGPAAVQLPSLTLVGVPLANGRVLLLWYLTPSPEIDARIRAAGWPVRVVTAL